MGARFPGAERLIDHMLDIAAENVWAINIPRAPATRGGKDG
jgi:hypothetical protein